MTDIKLPTFDSIAAEYDLAVAPKEVVRAVCRSVHSFMADCNKLATDGDDLLLVGGGNLRYYAGLEYSEVLLDGKDFTLYRARKPEHEDGECNAYGLIQSIAREREGGGVVSKPLKLWNGRAGIIHNWRRPAPVEHVYIAANSRADAARLLKLAAEKYDGFGGSVGQFAREIENYFSSSGWGNAMEGITPERGVWGSKGYPEKPWRIV